MRIFFLIIFVLGLSACSGTQKSTSNTSAPNTQGDNLILDLATYLSREPAVQVRGNGPTAIISIRGQKSINTSNEPLFVVDGVKIQGGFRDVYSIVNVKDIDNVQVLKDASETAFYGVQGANGVIVINLKKQ